MQHTKIEWVKNPDGTQGYTINPITGCLNQTDGLCKMGGFPCYAYRLANTRLRERYLANNNFAGIDVFPAAEGLRIMAEEPFYPRNWFDRREPALEGKKPKGIFVCDMADLFGIGVPEEWTRHVLALIMLYPQHRFYLLTKQPQNLAKFSPFPDNCWVGVTATNRRAYANGTSCLAGIKSKVKYLSIEPLLESVTMFDGELKRQGINWVIIGAQTKPTVMPKIEWVREIVEAADAAKIPVFLKDSLYGLFHHPVYENGFDVPQWAHGDQGINTLRQEMPR